MDYQEAVSRFSFPLLALFLILYFTFPNFKDYLGLGPAKELALPIVAGLAYFFRISPVTGYNALSFVSFAVTIFRDPGIVFRVSTWWLIGYLITQFTAGSYTPFGWVVFGAAVSYIRWLTHGPWTLLWIHGDISWTQSVWLSVSYCCTNETRFTRRGLLGCAVDLWSYLVSEARQFSADLSKDIDGAVEKSASFDVACARLFATVIGYLDLVDNLFKTPPPPAPVRPEEPAVVAPVEDPAMQEGLENEREARYGYEARVRQPQGRPRQNVAPERKLPPARFVPVRLPERRQVPPMAGRSPCYRGYSGYSQLRIYPLWAIKRKQGPKFVPLHERVRVVTAPQLAQGYVQGLEIVPTYQPVAAPLYVPAPRTSVVPGFASVSLRQQMATPQLEVQPPPHRLAVFEYHRPADLAPFPEVTVSVAVNDPMEIDDRMEIDDPIVINDPPVVDDAMDIDPPEKETKCPEPIVFDFVAKEVKEDEGDPMDLDGPEDNDLPSQQQVAAAAPVASAAPAASWFSMQQQAPAPARAPVKKKKKQPPPLLKIQWQEQAPKKTEIPGLVHQQPKAAATSSSIPGTMSVGGPSDQKAKETSSPKPAGPQPIYGLGQSPSHTLVQGKGKGIAASVQKKFSELVHLPPSTAAPAEASSSSKPTPASLPGQAAWAHKGGRLESPYAAGKSAASSSSQSETRAARTVSATDEAEEEWEDQFIDAVEAYMDKQKVDEETARAVITKQMGVFSR